MSLTEPVGAVETPASKDVTIVNMRGLHARASAKFVQLCETFTAEVTVSRAGESANGSSILDLMMLAAGTGSTITVSATGPQAHEAVEALCALVSSKFGESE